MVTLRAGLVIFCVLLGWSYSTFAAAGNRLIVKSSVAQIELGKAFFIELTTELKSPSLTDIDLTRLETDFYIHEKGDADYDATKKQQTLRLKLYARKQGILTIPKLQLSGEASAPLSINIKAATDPKTRQPIKVYFEFNNAPLWVKEQWVIKAGIITDEEIIRLDTEQVILDHFNQTIIPQQRHAIDGDNNYRHETGWILHPKKAGTFNLELPAVKYYRDGVNTHNFYPPRLQVKVRPLPVYVPGTVPVGRLSIISAGLAKPFLVSGNLNNYRLEIVSEGIQAADLPIIILQSSEPEQTVHYQSIKDVVQTFDRNGISNRISYSFPFLPAKSGLVTFSKIRLQYFDPDSGRLRSQIFEPGSWLSQPFWLLVPLILIIFVITLFIISLLIRWLLRKWHYFKTYQYVVDTISTSQDCNEYKKALQVFVRSEGWQRNPSLQQIKHAWEYHLPKTGDKLAVIDLLMRRLYRGEKIEIGLIRQELLLLIYSRGKLLRYI